MKNLKYYALNFVTGAGQGLPAPVPSPAPGPPAPPPPGLFIGPPQP